MVGALFQNITPGSGCSELLLLLLFIQYYILYLFHKKNNICMCCCVLYIKYMMICVVYKLEEGKIDANRQAMRHLDDRHWDLEAKSSAQFFWDHLLSTISALGGLQGLVLLAVGLLLFYYYILRTISTRHKKKSKPKKN